MPEEIADKTVAHKVEFALGQLDSLSVLPSVAAVFFPSLLKIETSFASVSQIIQSDPALTARACAILNQLGISLAGGRISIGDKLGKVPAQTVRDSFIGLKVFGGFETGSERTRFRRELTRHSLAVACCAYDIAGIASPKMDSETAYLAGLLHDIGKFALDEAMPKSFERIVGRAKSVGCSIFEVERKHLGADHGTLGKRLARKWHLPEAITSAIWLHHSDAGVISQSIPEARLALIVQLADLVARQAGIGESGSYDLPGWADESLQLLEIKPEQLEQIRQGLAEKVAEKSRILNLDFPNAIERYCEIVHTAVAELAHEQTQLSRQNRQLQSATSHLDFVADFLTGMGAGTAPIEAAEKFAVSWQKFYQTGAVCLYLSQYGDRQSLEAVVVESLAQSRVVSVKVPSQTPPVPEAVAKNFAVVDAEGNVDWLLQQVDVDFNLSQTKLVPLLCQGKAVGAIVFELRYPGDLELFETMFRTSASIAAAVLDMAGGSEQQERFAEWFAAILGTGGAVPSHWATETKLEDKTAKGALETEAYQTHWKTNERGSLEALAEMAGGAAHELNNPLSVVSGRAQLLLESEHDPDKERMLKQIQDNASEMSEIINDLMAFANPQQPRPSQTGVREMLDEAIQLTYQKTGVDHINSQIEIADGVQNVFVDSAQTVSALAHIFANSLESYSGELGPVKVSAEVDPSGDFVKLEISDLGCGMDSEVLRKATCPFYSAKEAGRRRGMGLAHAERLIELNRGSLAITSRLGEGTTVTISLPCR